MPCLCMHVQFACGLFPQWPHPDSHPTGHYTEADKDKIESEVGLFVKACTQQVEQLKNSVLAAQGAGPGAAADSKQGGRPRINEQTSAHLHGVVGSLVDMGRQPSAYASDVPLGTACWHWHAKAPYPCIA